MTKPLITAETEIGKKKRTPKQGKKIDYEELKTQVLALPLGIRANLAKLVKESIATENEARAIALKESEEILKEL